MLSRTADHLYWMARYTERAENTVRMLDVSYRMSLLPGTNGGDTEGWSAILDISELSDAFARTGRSLTARDVIEFVALDRDNPSSVWDCLRAARENAHAVRGTLTAEMWETTNATWLEIRDMTPHKLQDMDLGEFFEWVSSARTCCAGSPSAPCCTTTPSSSCAWAPISSAPTTPPACLT